MLEERNMAETGTAPTGAAASRTPRPSRLDGKALWLLAAAFFAVACGLHIWWGWFPKSIDVMPDEMRYLDTARSLFAGDGLILRGEDSTFQKILYPIAIMPALLFADGQAQVHAINVLNSVYACSTVFPVLVLARRIFRKPSAIVASMAASLLLPDLMYSMTFMTESLFIPLTLWLVALCWRCFESGGRAELGLAAAAGLLCYVVYLCKEVALMFGIAFLAWYLVACVRGRRGKAQAMMAAGLFLIGFLLPFVLMKLTLFSGMMNSYSQFSFDILESPYTVLFGLYAIATDATYFIVGFGVFPVLYLLCVWRDIPRRQRDLAFFCLVSLLVGFAVVVFTISMREDVGHVALRQHLRYVIPLFLPLFMLFAHQAACVRPLHLLRGVRSRAFAAALTAGFCVLVVAFFGSANLSQGFDNSEFHFMRYTLELSQPLAQEYHSTWANTMSAISADDGDLLVIDPVNWAWRAGIVAFTVVGMCLLLSRRDAARRWAGLAICCIICVFMVANSVCAYGYNMKAYRVDQADVDEICAIDGQLANREPDTQVVIVLDDGNTKNNNLVDAYVRDGAGEYDYLTPAELQARLDAAARSADDNLDDSGASGIPNSTDAIAVAQVDYLLMNRDQGISITSGNVELVGGNASAGGRYTLYRVVGGEPLQVSVRE